MITPHVKVTDKGYDRTEAILKAMRGMRHSYVTVGVHEDAGQYPDGTAVAEVAAANEFGTEHIPARSFIRATVDKNVDRLNKWRQELVGQIVDGKATPEKALKALGERTKILVQNRIDSDIGPRLSPKYAAWKVRQGKAPRTLVLTRLLYRSIGYVVHGAE